MPIYIAFTFWLILTIFAGIGVYRMWARLFKPNRVNWALLPGTVVSQMAYIFGCLITGGEVNKARLVPSAGGGEGAPTTSTTPALKLVGPVISSMMAIIACSAAIVILHATLGEPVMQKFLSENIFKTIDVSQKIPLSWDGLWGELDKQVKILRRMCETWRALDWLDWKVVLFVYLASCLAVRLGPVDYPIRPTLWAAVALSLIIAFIGIASSSFTNLITKVWPLLTYIWATLLFLLVITLVIRGIVGFYLIVAGKEKPTIGGAKGSASKDK